MGQVGMGEKNPKARTGLAQGHRGGLAYAFPAHTDPPSASAVNAVMLTAVGEEAMLACAVSGVPPPRVIWYRGVLGGDSSLGILRICFPEKSLVGGDYYWGPGRSWLVPEAHMG
jgi:hypothetical protein